MASLQCSKCGEGIHYHSMPEGIEYIYFKKIVWDSICTIKFDKSKKIMDESGIYPKLFRSSTIENDYSGQYMKIWKCQVCGTLHMFSNDGSVTKVFVKDNNEINDEAFEDGIMYDDYLWNEITDRDISNEKLSSIAPSLYVRLAEKSMVISKKPDFSIKTVYMSYNPEWME